MRRELPESVRQKVDAWNALVESSDVKQHFKITLDFKMGRAGNDVLAFDAVIAHYTMLHVLRADYFDLSLDHDELVPIKLPIHKLQHGDDYFYLCSYLNDLPNKTTFWVKRFEKQMLNAVDTKRVSTRQGPFKSYKMPILYSDRIKYVIWCTGNFDLVKQILPNPLHVGKKHAIGFGECSYKIEMQRMQKTNSLLCKGYLQRPLPVSFCEERSWKPENGIIENRPISPPYFGAKAKSIMCFAGGSKLVDAR